MFNILFATMFVFSLLYAMGFDSDKLLKTITQRFGPASAQKFYDWQKLVAETKKIADQEQQIKKVNEFWNRHIQYAEDPVAWGQDDYWATPMESLGNEKGDCEDYAIAKYFTLLSVGVDVNQLRLVYVRARLGISATNLQAHMVLAFYKEPEDEPMILDNLIGEIRPASRRPDLTPVFSFNSKGLWAGAAGGSASSGGSKRLSRWEDLLVRAHAEGFE